MIGGAKKLDIKIIHKFWSEMEKKNKIYDIIHPKFQKYCFIGSPQSNEYGYDYGFFIYKLGINPRLDNQFIKIDEEFAIKIVDELNSRNVLDYNNKLTPKDYNFKTTKEITRIILGELEEGCDSDGSDCFLEEKKEILITKDNPYDWFEVTKDNNIIFQGWIYKADPKPKYYIPYVPY